MTTHPNELPEAVKAAIRNFVTGCERTKLDPWEQDEARDIAQLFIELAPLWPRPSIPSADAVGAAAREIVAQNVDGLWGHEDDIAAILTRHLGSGDKTLGGDVNAPTNDGRGRHSKCLPTSPSGQVTPPTQE